MVDLAGPYALRGWPTCSGAATGVIVVFSFGRVCRPRLSNKYRQFSKLTAVETCPLTAYGDLERLELSHDLVHRVAQFLGFVFQLFHLWIVLEGAKSKWRKGQDELFPRNPTSRSHKAFSPSRTHLQIADGTPGVFTVSQSYAEQPVKTMREIPRHVDSPYMLAGSLLGHCGWPLGRRFYLGRPNLGIFPMAEGRTLL